MSNLSLLSSRNNLTFSIILHLSISTAVLKILGAQGLRDVRLEAYDHMRLGEEINLRCSYDLEGQVLYAVKYFKSDEHHVFLRNVSFDTGGRYSCSVSVEGNFQTLSSYKNITIVAIGYDAPLLVQRDFGSQSPGTLVEATCSTLRTSPHVNISWTVNGHLVTERVTTRILEHEPDPRYSDTISVIYFDLPKYSLRPVVVKCHAKMFELYDETSVLTIVPKGGQERSRSAQNNSTAPRNIELSNQFKSNGGVEMNFFCKRSMFLPFTFSTFCIFLQIVQVHN